MGIAGHGAGAVPALAQPSVDQILEKYAQALGGQAAYEKVTTRTMQGTVEIPDDNASGTAQVYAAAPEQLPAHHGYPRIWRRD